MNDHPHQPQKPTNPAPLMLAATFWFFCAILLMLSFVLCSCVSKPSEAERQLTQNGLYSNAIVRIIQGAEAVPTPVTPVVELLGAIALTGLGIWKSYLHNQITQVKNGNGKAKSAVSPLT
jgi:hypothetical protein